MDSIIFYSVLALIVAFFLYNRFAGVKGLRELDETTFRQSMSESNDYILIDVREPSEVQQGKIPGAMNIPLGQLSDRLQEVPKQKAVFLYCQGGVRSKQAGKILLANGYPSVTHLRGGIMAWTTKKEKP